MALTNHNLLVGSLVNLFNNSSVIPKPYSDYSGSLFFVPDQELTFRNNSPKGRVSYDETFIENKSFGNGFGYDKVYNIFVDFYTIRGVKDTEGNQGFALTARYLQLIEDAVVANHSSIGPVTVVNIADQEAPLPLDDLGNNVIGGRKLIVFRERR